MKYFLVLMLFLLALPANAAVIFMYHRFGEGDYPSTNVTLEQFEAQLDFLAGEGFNVWPLPKLVDHLQEGTPVPDKVVVITIDDAYESVYRHALPMLAKRNFPFTVFVATDPVDQKLSGYMNWQQLRELRDAGVTLANHSATHDYLLRRKPGESDAHWQLRVRNDIQKGQRRLDAELGGSDNDSPRLFAYPFGEYDIELARMVGEMAYVAFGQHSGAVGAHSDLRELPRFPVNERYGAIDDFSLKARSLPLPVISAAPRNPLRADEHAPVMTVQIGESQADLGQLNCYFGGKRMDVERLSFAPDTFRISVDADLPQGRSRYNCTAPHRSSGRWYWYSQLWIRNP